MVADEFVAASSYSDRVQTRRSRMAEFDRSKDAGVAPAPLLSAQMFTFGDAVLIVSEHRPDRGKPACDAGVGESRKETEWRR